MTKKQKQLLELLKNERKHLTAEEIFFLAKSKDVDISLASIYRILNILVDENRIKKIPSVDKQDTYDACIDNHEHLICCKCGKVKDIQIEGIKELLEVNTNVDIEDYDLCIHYICEDCKK